ncbi:gag-pol polyprotein, partial [Trifolium pratense]
MAAIEAERAEEREKAKKAYEEEEGEGIVDSQPLAQHLWETQVPEGSAPQQKQAPRQSSINVIETADMDPREEFQDRRRAARRYNTRVIQRRFREGNLVLKRPMGKDKGGKFAANWEGPFRIHEVFEGGSYRLETMGGEVLPRTWNVINL